MKSNLPYYSFNNYLKEMYNSKVYKISLNAGFTCPNRDGTLSDTGCIFCSKGGSGDFASSEKLSISDQIEQGKKILSNKKTGKDFIAYFQAYTNTYAPIEKLKKVYYEAIIHPDIVGLSIATRPDCINDEVISLLNELNHHKKIWIELGLQTIHKETSNYIRRGYNLSVFEEVLESLNHLNIDVIVHLIIGLPKETRDMLLQTIDYIGMQKVQGVKMQLLHILEGTDLARLYKQNKVNVLSMDTYIDLLIDCIERLPPNIVIHRMTGDGPKKLLIAPKWSSNKKVVLNSIIKRFKERNTFQGKLYIKQK
ncbi:MAG: TIGR01212 family radical SAM protein [Eubacteriales bacterium]